MKVRKRSVREEFIQFNKIVRSIPSATVTFFTILLGLAYFAGSLSHAADGYFFEPERFIYVDYDNIILVGFVKIFITICLLLIMHLLLNFFANLVNLNRSRYYRIVKFKIIRSYVNSSKQRRNYLYLSRLVVKITTKLIIFTIVLYATIFQTSYLKIKSFLNNKENYSQIETSYGSFCVKMRRNSKDKIVAVDEKNNIRIFELSDVRTIGPYKKSC